MYIMNIFHLFSPVMSAEDLQEPVTQISFDAPEPTSNVTVERPNATSFPYPMGSSFVTGVDVSLVSKFLIQ